LQQLNIFAVYASRQYLDAKIKTWVEFLKEWVANALAEDDAAFIRPIGAAASDRA
jgi:hypothetical protein